MHGLINAVRNRLSISVSKANNDGFHSSSPSFVNLVTLALPFRMSLDNNVGQGCPNCDQRKDFVARGHVGYYNLYIPKAYVVIPIDSNVKLAGQEFLRAKC